MGKIIRNGIKYSAATEAALNINYNNTDSKMAASTVQGAIDELSRRVVNITQAEYDALGDYKYTNNVLYHITDAEDGGQGGGDFSGAAADVSYDNAESGLEATNLQDAVDQVSGALNGMRFGVNENGEYGYYVTDSAGADTFIPFRGDSNRTYYYKKGEFAEGVEISVNNATYGKYTLNEDHIYIDLSGTAASGVIKFSGIDVTDINYIYLDRLPPKTAVYGTQVIIYDTAGNTLVSNYYLAGNIVDVTNLSGIITLGIWGCTGQIIYNIFGTKEIEAPTWIDRVIVAGDIALTQLLWTNPDSTVKFAAQTIPLDLSTYDAVAIKAIPHMNGLYNEYTTTVYCEVGAKCALGRYYEVSDAPSGSVREVIVETTGVTISDVWHGTAQTDTQNATAIPVEIYGINNAMIASEERVLEDIAYCTTANACPIIHAEDYSHIEMTVDAGRATMTLYGVKDPDDSLVNDYLKESWVSGATAIGSVIAGNTTMFDISEYAYVRLVVTGNGVGTGTYTLTGKRLSESSATLLWENTDGPAYTESLSIDLDLSDYEYFIVESWVDSQHVANDDSTIRIVHQKGTNDFSALKTTNGLYPYVRWRNSTITDTNITFGNGQVVSGTSIVASNWLMLPKAIYGVKGGTSALELLSIINA